ncbi:hypothetical protein [Streptomyces sp. NPDC056468]|uniref:hypothetical protein n=1 Tax=Streptomyces sp. NPDC056468 TaxID=3345830 RepID=UPI0036C54C62
MSSSSRLRRFWASVIGGSTAVVLHRRAVLRKVATRLGVTRGRGPIRALMLRGRPRARWGSNLRGSHSQSWMSPKKTLTARSRSAFDPAWNGWPVRPWRLLVRST